MNIDKEQYKKYLDSRKSDKLNYSFLESKIEELETLVNKKVEYVINKSFFTIKDLKLKWNSGWYCEILLENGVEDISIPYVNINCTVDIIKDKIDYNNKNFIIN